MKNSKLWIFGVLLSLWANSPGGASDAETITQLKELQGQVHQLSREFKKSIRHIDEEELSSRLISIMENSEYRAVPERAYSLSSDASLPAFMGLVITCGALGAAWCLWRG